MMVGFARLFDLIFTPALLRLAFQTRSQGRSGRSTSVHPREQDWNEGEAASEPI